MKDDDDDDEYVLEVSIQYKSPHIFEVMRQNSNLTLDKLVLNSVLDIGTSYGKHCVSIPAAANTSSFNPKIRIPVSAHIFNDKGKNEVIKPGTFLICALRVHTMTSNAVPFAVAGGGYGLIELGTLLSGKQAHTVSIQYDTWESFVAVVTLSNATLHRVKRDGSQNALSNIRHDDATLTTYKKDDELISKYFSECATRMMYLRMDKYPFPAMKFLTKFWTPIPKGLAMVSMVSHTGTGMSAKQLEEFAKCMLKHSITIHMTNDSNTHEDKGEKPEGVNLEKRVDEVLQKILDCCGVRHHSGPSQQLTKQYSLYCATALHLMIRRLSYFADRAFYLDSSNQMQAMDSDFFEHSCAPSPLLSVDDCDGSSSEAIRLMRHIGIAPFGNYGHDGAFQSVDPEYNNEEHTATKALRCGLFHYVACTSIVSAYGGEGSSTADSKEANKIPLAGHMTPFLLRIDVALDALVKGAMSKATAFNGSKVPKECEDLDKTHDFFTGKNDETLKNVLETQYALALLPENRMEQLPLSERPNVECTDENHKSASYITQLTGVFDNNNRSTDGSGSTTPPSKVLHLDGTVSNHPKLSCTDREEFDRLKAAVEEQSKFMTSLIGPLPGLERFVTLMAMKDFGQNGFIDHIVEVTMMVDTPLLRQNGLAAHSFIACADSNPPQHTGVTTCDFHQGKFQLMPAEWIDEKRGEIMDLIAARVVAQTMPPRLATPEAQLFNVPLYNSDETTKHIEHILNTIMTKVDQNTELQFKRDGEYPTVTFLVPARTLWFMAPMVTHALEDKLLPLSKQIHVLHTEMPSFGPNAGFMTIVAKLKEPSKE